MNEFQVVTPEMAEEWIGQAKKDSRFMRPIRASHVRQLSRLITEGQFAPNALVALAHLNGEMYILNGNHTLHAILHAGLPANVLVASYQLDTLDDLRHLYATFDKPLRRTRADSLRAYDAIELMELPATEVNFFAAAVAYLEGGFGLDSQRIKRTTETELVGLMMGWKQAAHDLRVCINELDSTMRSIIVRRSAVYAVALATTLHQPSIACDFWYGVCSGDGLSMYDPRHVLRDWLMVTGIHSGGQRSQTVVHGTYMSRVVAYAWNKYFEQQELKKLPKNIQGNTPMVLAGTPYK